MLDYYLPLFVIALFLFLLAIGIPIAFSLMFSGSFGLILTLGFETTFNFIVSIIYSGVSSYLFATVPMFILMAFILNESGLVEDIFEFCDHWIGHIRGGLGITTIFANGGMAVLSGSSSASAAAMASISIPEMRKYGYSDTVSSGTVSASGTFAIMLPPSVALIIYGILTETSIAALFIAGIVPGLLTLVGYIFVIVVWGYTDPSAMGTSVKKKKGSRDERLNSLRKIWPAGLLIITVIGGLYAGVVTPTEAGGLGAFGAFAIAVFIYRTNLKAIYRAHKMTAEITTMIFLIVISADVFSKYLTLEGITQDVINTVAESPFEPLTILLIILIIYILLGAFMDQLAILILTLPITYPLFVHELGYNGIWFGIFLIKTIEIGLVTPPFGMNIYVVAGVVDIDLINVFKGAVRFLVVDGVIIILLILYPEMVFVFL